MAYYPKAVEVGARYQLVSPDGVVAVFNDPTDPNYVGMLTDVTGLDSAEVRESAEDLVETDGGQHGNFYFGRRPITMTARVFGHASILERNLRIDRAERASLALRGDSVLTWKPSVRRDNLVTNPRAVNDTSGWITSGPNTGLSIGATLTRATGQTPPVGTTALQIVTSGATNTNQGAGDQIALTAGKTYTVTISHKRSSGTGTGLAYFADPAGAVTTFGSASATAWTTYTRTFVAASTGTYTFGVRQADSNTLASTFLFSDALVTEGTDGSYFDGDTAGYYWSDGSHKSISGDYVEMATWVRRQQPTREGGGWVKEIQLALVSQFAPVFSAVQQSTSVGAGPFSVENRGSYASYPIVRITGASANPTITIGSGVFKTTGLTLAIGETVEFDFLNHTGVFTAGARNGQSANRYIDFASITAWPFIAAASTPNVVLAGGGTFQVFWRDTWA